MFTRSKNRSAIAMLLATMLLISLALAESQSFAFADGEYTVTYIYSTSGLPAAVTETLPEDSSTYSDGDIVSAKSPGKTRIVSGSTVYTFDGWDSESKTVEAADVTFTGTWSTSKVGYTIEGTVYEYPYSGSESTATALSGAEVKISLKSGTKTVTTSSSGNFSYTFVDESLRTDNGKYSWVIEPNASHYSASGTASDYSSEESETSNKLYVQSRYEASSSDYAFVKSDDVTTVDGITWVKSAGTYKIEGKGSKKLAASLDGDAADTLSVTVSSSGAISSFFVYIGSLCSKVLAGQTVKIDSGAPAINSVTAEPASAGTYVKKHGVYAKTKAQLMLNADITDDVGIEKVYLTSTLDGETVTYEATAISGKNGSYTVDIPLPDEETIMEARLVKLVAVDVFGNKSAEQLIQTNYDEDGSKVTIEQIAPALSFTVEGSESEYGWYKDKPTLKATASDIMSGLADFSISGAGKTIAESSYDEKVTEEMSLSGTVDFDSAHANNKSGEYTYTAAATDNAGNEISKQITVKLDQTKPVVSFSGVSDGDYLKSSPAIKIEEEEKYSTADGNRIFVTVSRDGKKLFSKITNKVSEYKIPTETFSSDGVYKITAYAIDAANNKSDTINCSFVKDATKPAVSISGVKDGKYYNSPQTVSITVKEHNYTSDTVSISAVRKLGKTVKLSFPWKNKSKTTTSSKKYSETGTYTVTASAKDKAGNKGGPKKVSFTIDTKAPEITIKGVKDEGVYVYGQGLSPSVEVKDDYLATKSVTYTKAGKPITNPAFGQEKKNDGLYTMTATASDKAGNTTTKTISFTINRFGSYFEYNENIKALMGKAVQNVTGDLVITEKNISKVKNSEAKIYRDGNEIDAKGRTSADESGTINTYKHIFDAANFEIEGAYEINVISKDEVGNEMESRDENGSIKIYVDRTAPSLSLTGIDPEGNQASSITVDINANDVLTGVSEVKAYINDAEVAVNASPDGLYTFEVGEGMKQIVRVTATDGAGNTAETTQTASVSESKAKLLLSRYKFVVLGIAAILIAGIAAAVVAASRKQKAAA